MNCLCNSCEDTFIKLGINRIVRGVTDRKIEHGGIQNKNE